MSGIVPIAAVAQPHLLSALCDHAKGGVRGTVAQLRWRRFAAESHPIQRFGRTGLGNGQRDSLDQLISAGLHPICPMFTVLVARHGHDHPLSVSPPFFLSLLQILPIILDLIFTGFAPFWVIS